MKFRKAYDDAENLRYSLLTMVEFNTEDNKYAAVQSFKDDADINTIVKRFGVGPDMPAPRKLPEYGDFSNVTDFQTALNRIREAEQTFMSLPAEVRKKFDHNPHELITWLQDSANEKEARELGLIQKPRRSTVQAIDELSAKITPAETPAEGT